jgi:hypothetical protein
MTGDLYRRCWLPITLRDFVVLSCCLVYEHYSLRAFLKVASLWRRAWEKRQVIMAKRRVGDDYMASWFHFKPVSQPAPRKKAAAVLSSQTQTARS